MFFSLANELMTDFLMMFGYPYDFVKRVYYRSLVRPKIYFVILLSLFLPGLLWFLSFIGGAIYALRLWLDKQYKINYITLEAIIDFREGRKNIDDIQQHFEKEIVEVIHIENAMTEVIDLEFV